MQWRSSALNLRGCGNAVVHNEGWLQKIWSISPFTRNFSSPAQPKSKKLAEPKTPMQVLPEIKTNAKCKFDESVDLALRLNLDPRKAEQNLRGLAVLPHGTGKKMKVAVFATGKAAEEAKAAGATHVGAEDLVEKIKGGMLDFDRCIATPAAMPQVTKIAKILGPRGMMPNPKIGTVTDQVAEAMKKLTSGVTFKTDKFGIVHACVGKVSFQPEKLAENVKALTAAVHAARPRGSKEPYIISAHMSSTMGSSHPVIPASLTGGDGGAAASASTTASSSSSTWEWKEPVEPKGDPGLIASKKLRRFLYAKRGLDPHTPWPPPPAAPAGKKPAAAAAAAGDKKDKKAAAKA